MARVLIFYVSAADEGRAVRDVLRDEFHLVAHDIASAKYRIPDGITVNGEVSLTSRILRCGDELRVVLFGEPSKKTVPTEGPLEILYEDEDVICLNKPAGLVVHPSHGHFADSLGNYLAYYYSVRGVSCEIRTVGRLDKDTSGVICFAKSRTACAILSGQTEGKGGQSAAKKEYLALAQGTFECSRGEVDAPISREYEEKIQRVVREDGASARTAYSVLKQYEGYALLSVLIETGRTHQIRVHMAHIGHPLLGDPIYGNPAPPLARAALHCRAVSFRQPFEGRQITVTAPVPADFLSFLGDIGDSPHCHVFFA